MLASFYNLLFSRTRLDNTNDNTDLLISAQLFRKILSRQDLQDKETNEKLMSMYKSNDPLLNAAFETYYDDQDKIASFLKRLASRVTL